MWFYFPASIAGLFPGLILPMGLGWRAVHPFDWLTPKGRWLWIGLMLASQSSAQGNLHPTVQ